MVNPVYKKRNDFPWTSLPSWVRLSLSGVVIDGRGPIFEYFFSLGEQIGSFSIPGCGDVANSDSFQSWRMAGGIEKLIHFQKLFGDEDEAIYTLAELDYENIVNKFTINALENSSAQSKNAKQNANWDEISLLKSQIRTFLNSAPEAILLLDFEKLTYVVANSKAEDLFGLPEKDLIKRHLGQLSPEKQPGGALSSSLSYKFLTQAAEGKEVRFEWLIQHSSGQMIPVEVRVVRIPDSQRILLRCSIIDISDRKRYEKILRENEERYRNLFDLHRTPMMYHDFQTGIRHINKSFQELMGLSASQHTIEDFESFIHHDEIEDYRKNNEDLLHQKLDNYLLEIRCVRMDGQVRSISMSVSAVRNADGQVIATLRMLEDITPQRQAQDEIKERNLALEKMNRELDAFVYTVAHDIRASLASLKGLNQLMKDEQDSDTLENYNHLQEICVRRMDSFIHEIADYSRNKKSAIKIEEVDVPQLISDVFDQHKFMAYERGKVHFELKSCPHKKLWTDSGRLGIVLNNIISNAIKYSDDSKSRKSVCVEVQDAESDLILIKVIDNGVGIDQEHLERIFEMFYRISHNIEGTGMGLHIVKEAMDKISGKIKVESQKGIGTTFVLELKNLHPNN